MDLVFFATPAEFRKWLARNHSASTELVVGFYKKGSGRPSITWPESVDEALCYGWIDGVRRGLDAESYSIRFTPRRPRSIWSAVNIRRVEELEATGRMTDAGRAAFAARTENRSGIYSYEQRKDVLEPEHEAIVKKNKKAWAYWQKQPPSYRRAAVWWVVSAKKDETRMSRLERLIVHSEAEEPIPQFRRRPGK